MTTQTNETIPCIKKHNACMPVLGLGTYESDGNTCRQSVRTALQLGYRHIDTARMYENEDQVGAGIQDAGMARDDLFVTTKLRIKALDPQGVRQSCDQSLSDLKMDYVDLLLIHWPEEEVPLADTLGTMAELKQEGKVRNLGISNFTAEWVERAVKATQEPILCNQIEYHPYLTPAPIIEMCRKHDIAITAYSPLARGQVIKDTRLASVANKHHKTPAQIALRWLVRQPDVAVIPKGSEEKHIRDNMAIFDFDLDEEDLTLINGFADDKRLIDPDFAPEWDPNTTKESQ